jgi:misacylated tRNA(Ala) deacylase
MSATTELLYMDDSYVTTFEATVLDVSADGVILDRTLFYPTGGGQPHDVGTLAANGESWQVVNVRKRGPGVAHALDGDSAPTVGETVTGTVDWERRYKLMRTHTALHVLCGVIFRDYGASVTGANIQLDKARMDFELEEFSADRVGHIEEQVNAELRAERSVSWRVLPRDEAFQIPDLIRTKINLLPPQITEVRVVEIEGLDLQADGGTHVRNTAEVGQIKVIGTRSKGRSNKRIELELVDN